MLFFISFIYSNHNKIQQFNFYRHSWDSTYISYDSIDRDDNGNNYFHILNLLPNTQYAFYVKTHVSYKAQDKTINVTQGQSELQYFRTLPSIPIAPFVFTLFKSNHSITFTWHQPSYDKHPFIDHYAIDVFAMPCDQNTIDERDYCVYPKEYTPPESIQYYEPPTARPKPKRTCCQPTLPPPEEDHQRIFKAMINLDYENFDNSINICGDDDPICNKYYEYHRFKRSITQTLEDLADAINDEQLFHEIPIPKSPKPDSQLPIAYTKEKTNPNYMYSKLLKNDTSKFTIANLKPYHMYGVHVYACNSISGCSEYFMHFDRTDPTPGGDDVSMIIEKDDEVHDTVHITILPPKNPNGITVAFQIERTLNNEYVMVCITRKMYEQINYK